MIRIFKTGCRLLLIMAVMSLSLNPVKAQSLKVSARFDSTTIKIGDQVKLSIELDQPANVKVKFPLLKDSISRGIEVVKVFPPDSSKKDGNLHIRQEFLVTSFDSGLHYVAPLAFLVTNGKMKDTIRTSSLSLTVNTMRVDTMKNIIDIKAPAGAPFSLAELLPYFLITLGLFLVGFAIWFFVKKFRKEPVFNPRKVVEPPHVVALRELDALRSEKLWQNDKTKLYYTKLTDILRAYIENRYEVGALEMTSDQLIRALRMINLDDFQDIDELRNILVTADLVKFAKATPLPNENEICLLHAYQFINNTKPVTPVDATESGNTGEADKDVVK
ncbi:MAG: hypothetical protein Q8928_19070 [Bacteroidota bacterium]|nr:hypothetical protein [Bacteroidota bacterium]